MNELKPYDFDQWLEKPTQWNPTSKAHAVTLILAAVSWAVKKGFIQTNPLARRVERPQPILRGRDARMSEELMDLLIGECFEKATYSRKNRTDTPGVHLKKTGFCEPFGKYMWLLRLTGARPGELRHAEAFNYENGRLVFRWNAQKGYIWKNAKKSQRDRIIFLSVCLVGIKGHAVCIKRDNALPENSEPQVTGSTPVGCTSSSVLFRPRLPPIPCNSKGFRDPLLWGRGEQASLSLLDCPCPPPSPALVCNGAASAGTSDLDGAVIDMTQGMFGVMTLIAALGGVTGRLESVLPPGSDPSVVGRHD